MATKTLGTIAIVLICVLLFPLAIGIVGAVFGAVFGVIGGVFGAIFGVIGGLLGAVFGVIGGIFESVFDWDIHPPFMRTNVFTFAALIVLIILLTKRNQPNPPTKK